MPCSLSVRHRHKPVFGQFHPSCLSVSTEGGILRAFVCAIVLSCIWTGLARGQSLSPHANGSLDSGTAPPESAPTIVRRDAAALDELTAHVAAVGAISWIGFKGVGSISYSASGADAVPATLYIYGKDRFRLDANTAAGVLSIRTHDGMGEVIPPNSKPVLLPPDTATVGSIHLQFLRSANAQTDLSSAIDRGLTTVDGQVLHRITAYIPKHGRAGANQLATSVPLDLYFDPATHLLVKSAAQIKLPSTGRATLLQVMTYSNYQKVGDVLVPFGFRETLDGHFHWAITLTQVAFDPAPPHDFFAF